MWVWLLLAAWFGGLVGFVIGAMWHGHQQHRRIRQDLWQQIHGVSGKDRHRSA